MIDPSSITLCLRCVVSALALLFAVQITRGEVTGEQVRKAIDNGVRALKRLQTPNGNWADRHYPGGETCLATMALLQSGVPADSPLITRPIAYIRGLNNQLTYVTSLKILAMAQADAKRYRADIHEAAKWLIAAQQDSGLWGYTQYTGPWDNSNTQFALLGLYAAADIGFDVPPQVWAKARQRLLAIQDRDGGFSYRGEPGSYGSMTAAGVADLIILGSNVAAPQEKGFRDGAAPNCGKYVGSKPLIDGLNWLGRNFAADSNPRRGNQWVYYWLYAVERCGILSGRRYFGRHDWYREGAAHFINTQRPDGTWAGTVSDTAFGVLFLSKGHKPLLIQKLQWSSDESWNPDRHDVENLIAFIGDTFGEPTAWQTVTFDSPLEDWLAAPLLYVQGHTFPPLNDRQRKKLREFVEQGGTLFFEACCSKPEFRAGFERFAAAAFPETPLRELDSGHPLYSAQFDLPPAGLMGLDLGCRTSVLFSPRDLSCLWEQAKIPMLSEQAFKLGTNIAAFALGRQALRDRLDVLTLPGKPQAKIVPPTADALRLAQLVYNGDWRPDAGALVHFAEYLRDNAGLDVITEYATPRLTDESLYSSPILFMTGHYPFELVERERAGLVAHLRRGGFLIAEACCGRREFDQAFRAMVSKAFPNEAFKRLPPEHALFAGQPGVPIRSVGYKPAALSEKPDLDAPELWGVEIDGRLVLVYSPYSIGCGLDGHKCFNCRGLLDDDARKLAANIILYALTR
jgi:hypothetical protein